jgi:aminoglycoside phosphotransferase (APT) family kinase protein
MDLAGALATCNRWQLQPRPAGRPSPLRRLAGESNESWLLRWGDRRLVLRLERIPGAAPGLCREEEYRIQAAAAAAGLAPVPRYGDARCGLLVSDYLAPGAAPQPDHALRADLLRAIHGLAVDARPLALPDYLDACALQARDPAPALTTTVRALAEELGAAPGGPVLCHNDLSAANRLWHGDRLLALDWEYAARGNPWYDIAAGASDDTDARRLLAAYLERAPQPAEDRCLALALAVSACIDALWYTMHGRPARADWRGVAARVEALR